MLDQHLPEIAGPPHYAYMLVEALGDGSQLRDLFGAPSNAEAIARAGNVIEGRKAELWRGEELICAWPQPARTAARQAVADRG